MFQGLIHVWVPARGVALGMRTVDGEGWRRLGGEVLHQPTNVDLAGGRILIHLWARRHLRRSLHLTVSTALHDLEPVSDVSPYTPDSPELVGGLDTPEVLRHSGDQFAGDLALGFTARAGDLLHMFHRALHLPRLLPDEGAPLLRQKVKGDGLCCRPCPQGGELLSVDAKSCEAVDLRGHGRTHHELSEKVLVLVLMVHIGREARVLFSGEHHTDLVHGARHLFLKVL
mmetsp:Transcript_67177/g.143764  ORF Transcript_67177/g.143764 Transcript_67177/m.143764 type:complete len:228 (+) Transcript_67177:269-952(+)